MSRILLPLFVLVAGCDRGTYILINVQSAAPAVVSSIDVTSTNAGQTARNRFQPAAPVSLPQSFSLSLDGSRRGEIRIDVVANGPMGEIGRGGASTSILPGGTTSLTISLNTPMPIGDMSAPPPDLATPQDLIVPVPPDLSPPGLVWASQDSTWSDTLYGVWGNGVSAFAVGQGVDLRHGVVLASQDRGKTWAVSKSTDRALLGIWGIGVSDVYAVGYDGIAIYFDGRAWKDFLLTRGNLWQAMSGPANEIYLVGDDGAILISMTGFASQLARSQVTPNILTCISALAGNAYAADNRGLIVHSIDHGNTWMQADKVASGPLAGIWTRANETWAVGANGVILRSMAGGRFESQSSGTMANLNGIWCNDTDCFTVGDGGTILHFDGTRWKAENAPTSQNLRGVFGTPTDIYAVGNKGTILHASLK